MLHSGQILGENYELLSHLGTGAAAEVWKARHRQLGSLHAIKVLHPGLSKLVDRMELEAQLQARIRHPGVVRMQERIEVRGQPALVLEFVDGPSLETLLRRGGELPLEAVGPLAIGLMEGLEAIHQAGLVHRDFKPANVLLAREGTHYRPKVTDFGIARGQQVSGLTRQGAVMGTPAFMAPEQIRDAHSVDARADIWSLGCVLYEMLLGRAPFQAKSLPLLLSRILQARPRPLPQDLPRSWRRAVASCLMPEREDRPATLAELRQLWLGEAERPAPLPMAALTHLLPEPQEDPGPGTVMELPTQRSNLPSVPAQLVGRRVELEALQAQLEPGRLLTLTGPGGVGKSHLARVCGSHQIPRWPGGVFFVELAELRDASGLAPALGQALGLGQKQLDALERHLADRAPTLLILDNLEQLQGHCEDTLARWHRAMPQGAILTTSRARLGIAGERTLPLGPMPLPPSRASAAELSENAAVRLFIERSGLPLDRETAPVLSQLIHRLEGLPLAIELAAARCRVLAPRQLLERMDRRFALLKGQGPERHSALWKTIDWSWQLLAAWEQDAMLQLSELPGSFDLEAAQTVLSLGEGPESPWPEDALRSLLDKSLLTAWQPESAWVETQLGRRFGMLESVREYCQHRAAQAAGLDPGRRRGARWRIAHHFAHQAAQPGLELALDQGNLALALEVCLEEGLADQAASVALALSRLARMSVLSAGDPRAHLERALEAPGLSPERRARTLSARAAHAGDAGEVQTAIDMLLQADGPELGPGTRAYLASHRAVFLSVSGQAEEAEALCAQAAAWIQQGGTLEEQSRTWSCIGLVSLRTGKPKASVGHYSRAARLAKAHGDYVTANLLDGNRGGLMMVQGELEEAEQALRQAYHRSLRLGDRVNAAVSGCNLGILMGTTGRDRKGAATLEAAMTILQELGHHNNLAWAWVEQAPMLRRLGHKERARARLLRALERAGELPDPRLEGRALAELALWDSRAGRHAKAIRRAERGRKLLFDSGDHLNLLVAIGALGCVLLAAGRKEEAGLYLREGEALIQRLQLSERSPWALQWGALRERANPSP